MRSEMLAEAKEPNVSRRWRQVVFQAVIIVVLVVGLRLILGEWNWWLTVIGAAWILLSNLWTPSTRHGDANDSEGTA